MEQFSEILASEPVPELRTIVVVDGDIRRRAEIARTVFSIGYTFPVESVAELDTYWPARPSLLLVHDDSDAIGELVNVMNNRAAWHPFIGFHADPSVDQVVEAMDCGASDYWRLPVSEAHAATRVQRALDRARESAESRARKAMARRRLSMLSTREREVISGLTMGYSNKEIAQSLGISPRTVEIHRANMKDRINVRTTAEAVRLVIEADLS